MARRCAERRGGGVGPQGTVLRQGNKLRALWLGNLVFVLGVLCGLMLASVLDKVFPFTGEPDIAHYREVRDFVQRAFVSEQDEDDLLDSALHGLIADLDPYSRYYDARETVALNRDTDGRYRGIGVLFKHPIAEGRVLFTVPGSPAHAAGLEVGDLILDIDGQEVTALDAEGVHDALAGAGDDPIHLRVQRIGGELFETDVERRSLIDPTLRHPYLLDEERGLAYFALISFSNETLDEFESQFRALRQEGMQGLVLDLRGNPGGVLTAAVEIARLFIPSGVIVSTEGRGEQFVFEAIPAQALYEGFPLVLLVDGGSASASEVLAAALQDHRCAVIVGTPTFGKGLVQTIRHFPEREAVAKVTSAYYYTPSGRNLDKSIDDGRDFGIEPDVEVALDGEGRRALYEYLGRYSPPRESIEALRAWEEREGLELLPRHPDDPQLDVALALLRGEHPDR